MYAGLTVLKGLKRAKESIVGLARYLTIDASLKTVKILLMSKINLVVWSECVIISRAYVRGSYICLRQFPLTQF